MEEHGTAIGRVWATRDQTLPDEPIAERRRAREAHAKCFREIADAKRLPPENEEGAELGECEIHVRPGVG